MTTPPPSRISELLRRGIRLLAAAVVALIVIAVTALSDGGAVWPLAAGAAFLAAAATLQLRSQQRSSLATSAVVVGLALVTVGARALITPTGDDLDLFLWVAGALFLVSGAALDERRLVSLGLLQWAIVLLQPSEGAAPFRHCLVATDLAIPVPTLDEVLLLGIGGVVLGTAGRYGGWRSEAARGAEVTGLTVLAVALLAKAAELPDLAVLCGGGRGIDTGWLLLTMGIGLAAGVYGGAGRDPVWAGVGGGMLALAGLMGTVLSGEARWAILALVPLMAALVLGERLGVNWPHGPGYGRRRPWERR